ncbi:MAG TPA: Fic family protein [Bacilli bacterium]|jgi:Fic family protein|nr:Fic family protein [Bacilli bacterium]HOC97424.1 Fic family protein [Bacilli bacterium]HPV54937.1 Fic family protein [Bacilli bacterium]HPX82931.1 Fic family protein [Bacilli bacterium]HQM17828.1 Fic family protein [Bacilli bacterium]
MEKFLQEKYEAFKKLAAERFSYDKIDLEFITDLVYNSLTFERRAVTREDIKNILSGNHAKYDEKLVTTAENHRKAFLFMVDLAKKGESLTESKLKDCHSILMDEHGGLYRTFNISIQGSQHTPPPHYKIYARMDEYFEVLKSADLPINKIAYSHLQLSKIHPFLDGNGRLARLVLNYYMLASGLAPIIIPSADKENYFQCLEDYKVKKTTLTFINYLIQLEEASFEKYFK